METTSDQRRAFGEAAENLLEAAGIGVADAAAELDMTYEGLRLYLKGQREPKMQVVFKLERLLEVEPGRLSHLLGYLPPEATEPRPMSVAEAVDADPRLNKRTRQAVLSVYKALVGEA